MGNPMNCSLTSGVGSRFGFFCTTIRTSISCAQLIDPVTPVLARLRHLPLDVWWKRSPAHSFSKALMYVGVVVTFVVRKDENPFPFERRTESFKTHHGRPAGVACSFQVSDDPVSADILEIRNVLNEYPAGLEFADDAGVFDPEDGTVSDVESTLLASGSATEVLAGEAAADEIDWLEVAAADVSNVGESWDIGPPSGEDFVAELVDFNLPCGLEPSPFQAKINSTDACEQAAMGQRHDI